jgi:hypothetical protein
MKINSKKMQLVYDDHSKRASDDFISVSKKSEKQIWYLVLGSNGDFSKIF